MASISDRLLNRLPPRARGRLALELHRRGVYRLGMQSFGAFDRNVTMEQFGINLVFDVGANVGGWARMLRDRGYAGRLVSLEPGSPQYAVLEAAAKEDPRWEVHHAGAGDEDAIQQFNVASNWVSSSFLDLGDSFGNAVAGVNVASREDVQIYRLDRFADTVSTTDRVWLKLDVEGYELKAIAGAHKLLEKTTLVDVELATNRQYEHEPLFFDVAAALYARGFELIAVTSAVTAPSGRTVRFDGLFGRPESWQDRSPRPAGGEAIG